MNNSPVRRKFAEIGSVTTKLGREQCEFRACFSQDGDDWTKKGPPAIRRAFSPSTTSERS
jgi:hypothetical protein